MTIRTSTFLWTLTALLLCHPLAWTEETHNSATPPQTTNSKNGVLIVAYNTGRNAERLDRVRFRLINEHKEQTMYPRAGTYYENAGRHTRRVTISNLPAGKYVIEFIVPNTDGLFSSISARQITLGEGEIIKVDQTLKPRYARVKATALVSEGYTGPVPTLRLCSHRGTIAIAQGELITNNLLPGQYSLFFDPLGKYIPPDPIHFEVKPGAVVGPFERHYKYPYEASVVAASGAVLFPESEMPPPAFSPTTLLPAAAGTAMHPPHLSSLPHPNR